MINYCKNAVLYTIDDRTGKDINDVTHNSDATSKYLYNDYLKYDPTISPKINVLLIQIKVNLPCKLSITFKIIRWNGEFICNGCT